MKKNLLAIIAFFAIITSFRSSAAPFWYDVVTNYPGGCITTNTANWFPHLPGGLTANDLNIVTNTYTSGAAVSCRRLRVDGLNSANIMRLFGLGTTNRVTNATLYVNLLASAE